MKKISILLIAVIGMALASCGNTDSQGSTSGANKKSNQELSSNTKSAAQTIVNINSVEEFEALRSGDTPILIDFNATWCGPCKIIAPRLHELAKEMEGKFILVKVDIDKFGELAQEYNVRSIPMLYLQKGGKESWSHIGVISKEDLVKEVGSRI